MTGTNTDDRTVWYSDMLMPWKCNPPKFLEEVTDLTAKQNVKMYRDLGSGIALEREVFAKHLSITSGRHDMSPLPEYFKIRFPCVSARFRAFIEP